LSSTEAEEVGATRPSKMAEVVSFVHSVAVVSPDSRGISASAASFRTIGQLDVEVLVAFVMQERKDQLW
jgi:hypothetical protein